MIQNKIPNNNASDEESDHNYSELSFELNTNPTQFRDYMSNYDFEDQFDLLHFETIIEQDEIIQELLLNDEIALCEQITNKLENKKIATKLPNETLTNKDNLTQIFTSFNNLGKKYRFKHRTYCQRTRHRCHHKNRKRINKKQKQKLKKYIL